jgi:post-segregation antitoxin (ccd killing protein)
MPSGAFTMVTKGNVVLYLDRELVEKSKELGFNLSKTLENHLKQLITQFSQNKSLKNADYSNKNVSWWAEPDLNQRPLARKANVLTKLDDQPNLQIESALIILEVDGKQTCKMRG